MKWKKEFKKQFKKSVLVVEENNYKTKATNAYIVYDLDDWSKIPLNDFMLWNCFFGATNIANNSDRSEHDNNSRYRIVLMD